MQVEDQGAPIYFSQVTKPKFVSKYVKAQHNLTKSCKNKKWNNLL